MCITQLFFCVQWLKTTCLCTVNVYSTYGSRHYTRLKKCCQKMPATEPLDLPDAPIRVFFCNCQSLRNKIEDLEFEVQDLDIVCLAESWLGPSVTNESLEVINFDGPIRRDRPGQEYGGVCTYVRKGIPWNRRQDLEHADLECLWLEINTTVGKFLLGTIYRPPNSRADLWHTIQQNLDGVMDVGLDVVLTGDINCDQAKLPNRFNSILIDCGLKNHNNELTHVTPTTGTSIDFIASNFGEKMSDCILTPPRP